MRSFFSRTPDLEGGRAYKKGFTGDHRGRSHIPPNPSPLFSPQSQFNPFGAPPAVYRHDTIFKPAPSPSPKSVVFSERSWSASGRQGTAGAGAAAALDRGQLDRSEDLPDVYPMGEHRAMLRTMYLEDILHSTAKLHKHNWILMSRNAKYKDLRVPERWDQIQEDLEKYTRSIRNYEYWLTSSMPTLELSKSSLPPRFHLYGKQLAILEIAKYHSHSSESSFANELEQKLVAYHTDWSNNYGSSKRKNEI
ncbi:hypothetical protein EYC84_001968 [Monilinia fructicola]|uniref:Uncharacterized protein n=1 Tax=Monilinia fructicola TaxID=38448 RepID=A0A5M9JTT7_MONFR|nr:hypothetical protein EYC84_001968 [Monilinia fructicola]